MILCSVGWTYEVASKMADPKHRSISQEKQAYVYIKLADVFNRFPPSA